MAPSQRRRSIDSSSSSSSGTPPGTHDHQSHLPNNNNKTPSEPGRHTTSRDAQWSLPNTSDVSYKGNKHEPPPGYTPSSSTTVQPPVPPSGYRIPLSVPGPPFPGVERTRRAPFTDLNGTPVFIGSAITQHSVHPCKIAPNSSHTCYVAYGGEEILHQGRYDLLPFVPEHMEFVPTSHGQIPPGRRPIKGGFEHDGSELYHAVAVIDGVKVPGKTGTHLVRPWNLLQTLSACGSSNSCLIRGVVTSLSVE
jgi:hypothetical protein